MESCRQEVNDRYNIEMFWTPINKILSMPYFIAYARIPSYDHLMTIMDKSDDGLTTKPKRNGWMRSWSRSQLTNTQFLISLSLLKKSNSENGIFVSYDVSALFTSVPLEETIHILANKARPRIGSTKRISWTSPRMILLNHWGLLQNINSFSLTDTSMNKLTELPWALS